ncbi:MAG TPA: class I SAM-dependent methyltransferase [Thermotogota bacterium]|nr:class I SAM-dependent methyltransferase [Thermotogota bacterium]HPJ88456.1 class I SAM-dependent methyltransferase [Thermotogota bacterium]HPR96505.1 class I SAM-dependent methyltransferase [Thermotogota bacterium]
MTKYDLIAFYYDFLLGFFEKKTLRPLRRRFVPQINGKTLDIAIGTGNNIEFYPADSDISLVDSSLQMLKLAERKADRFNRKTSLSFVRAVLESLPFQDESFDSILSIDVFCSVDKPEKALNEVYRVLKYGGKAIFVEHMKTGRKLQDLFLGFITLFTLLIASSSMIRPIDRYIRESEFEILSTEKLSGSFRYYLCTKKEEPH